MPDRPWPQLAHLGPIGPFIHHGQGNYRRDVAIDQGRSKGRYQLWWIGPGRAWLERDGEHEAIGTGTLILQQPHSVEAVRATSGTEWMRLTFDWVHQGLAECERPRTRYCPSPAAQPTPQAIWGRTLPLCLPTSLAAVGSDCLRQCLALYWRSVFGYHRANNLLGAFLLDCLEQCGDAVVQTTGTVAERLERRIEQSLEYDLGVDELARAAGLNQAALRRYIDRHFGCTPRVYLARRRVERAKRALREEPDATLQQIARLCGFASLSAFCRRFRQEVGCTPGAWRAGVDGDEP